MTKVGDLNKGTQVTLTPVPDSTTKVVTKFKVVKSGQNSPEIETSISNVDYGWITPTDKSSNPIGLSYLSFEQTLRMPK